MKMRKLFAGVIAAATMLGGLALGASTANAAEGAVVSDTAKFTFTASSEAQLTGRTITAYKIGDYVQYGSDSDVAYGVQSNAANKDAVKTALETALDEKDLSDDALTNALADGKLDTSANRPWADGTTRKFADALAKGTLTGGTSVTLSAPAPVTGATGDGAYAATVTLPAGIYLFVDSSTSDAVTKAVPMIVYSGTLSNKALTNPTADAPSVNFKNTKNTDKTKSVDEGSVSVGQTVHYTLSGVIANPAPSEFSFVDTPGTGLTVNLPESAENLNGFSVTASDVKDPLVYSTDYTVKSTLVDGKGDNAKTFTVKISDPSKYAGKTITVKYTAVVNDDANVENGVVNKLDNYGTDVEKTNTFSGFDFQKIDVAKNGVNGATFQIKSGEDTLYFVKQDDGTYKKVTASTVENATADLSTAAVNNKDGVIKVTGLGEGTYTVTETKPADGYVQSVKAAFTVTIAKDGTPAFSVDAGQDALGLVDTTNKTVLNVKNITQLPLTGAAGTALFTVIGLLLAGAAATVALKSRETKRALRA